ncbi:MAG: hypothetical protein GY930_06380 [bacterium]|nr:hypothetical protein [bacterium]
MKVAKPERCFSCDELLSGSDRDPWRHQIIDIPPIKPHLTEYEVHKLWCLKCGEATSAVLPDDVHQSNFGPNLSALVVLLGGECRM